MSLESLSKSELIEIIKSLQARLEELEARLTSSSYNSSRPPSSDTPWQRAQRPSKSGGRRKPGGQKGHTGNKLKKFDLVDHRESHELSECPVCISKHLVHTSVVYRQIIDIPEPRFEVTEHAIHQYQCNGCGHKVEGGAHLGLVQEAQYGPRIKSLVGYLNVHQLIPYKRLTEMIEDLFGLHISQGSISNFNKEIQKGVDSYLDSAYDKFIDESSVIHSDETGCMVNKKLHWVHVYSDQVKTLLFGHEKRGSQAIEDIGILPQTGATIIHDRYYSYLRYDNISHGLCNAHLLRDLKGVKDMAPNNWPDQIKNLLLQAKTKKEQGPLSKTQIKRYINKYESILRNQRIYYQKKDKDNKGQNVSRGHPKKSKDHNLFVALWKYRKSVMRFITDAHIPFDNNQAERDFRMLKVKMKVSNQFKTADWLGVHNDIRSYISTAIKQKLDVLDCLYQALIHPQFAAQLAV